MIGNDAQKPDTHALRIKSNAPEEVSEPIEEPDQRRQDMQMRHLPRNEKIRLVIIGVALLVVILGAVLFLFTRSIVPLFVTIVVVPLFYRCVDVYLDKSEASER